MVEEFITCSFVDCDQTGIRCQTNSRCRILVSFGGFLVLFIAHSFVFFR